MSGEELAVAAQEEQERSSSHGLVTDVNNEEISSPGVDPPEWVRLENKSVNHGVGGGSQGRGPKKVSLVPTLGRTPMPTPTIFEWRTDMDRKIVTMDHRLESLKSGEVGSGRGGGRTSSTDNGVDVNDPKNARSFRLTKEFEDEEVAFQRNTTKIALDISKAEAERAISAAKMVETLCLKLQDRLEAFESKYERDMKDNAKVVLELQTKLGQLSAERDVIKTKVDALQDESKAKDKRASDLEDVIFFLQDEIAKNQQAITAATAKSGAKAGVVSTPPAPIKKKK